MPQSGIGLLPLLVRSPSRSIASRLFLILIGIVCLSVAGVGGFAYSQARGAIVDQAAGNAAQAVALGSEKLDMKQQSYMDLSTELMNNNDFVENLFQIVNKSLSDGERQTRIGDIRSLLDQLALSDSRIRDITLIPMEDELEPISTLRDGVVIDRSAAWIRQAMAAGGHDVWLPLAPQGYVNEAGKPVIACARLIGKRNLGSHDFIFIVQVDAAVLTDMLAGIQLGSHSEITLFSSGGEPLWSNLSEGDHRGADMTAIGDVGTGEGAKRFRGEDGKRQIAAYRASPVSGWTLVGVADLKELTGAADRIRLAAIIAIMACAIAAIAVGFWLASLIGVPLRRLQMQMDQAANGILSGRLQVGGRDEIGQVAAAYNQMMQEIGSLVQEARDTAADMAATGVQVAEAAAATASSAQDIRAASGQIAVGAVQLSTSAEHGNGLVRRMSRGLAEACALQSQMAESAREAGEACRQGGQSVRTLTESTEETERRFRTVGERVAALKAGAGSLDEILKILQTIAKKTKILSFNATIEAARAGAAGAGFKVIVDEIRRMAEQTDASIQEAGNLTESIHGEIENTAATMKLAVPTFGRTIDEVRAVHRSFLRIEDRMKELILRASEVEGSLRRLDEEGATLAAAMSEVSAIAEESTAASEETASRCAVQSEVSSDMLEQSRRIKAALGKLEEQMTKFHL